MAKKYKWCMHCEKVYKNISSENSVYTDECPHCGASVFADGWDWSRVRDVNPEYPENPEIGKTYPMYKSH